MLVPIHIQLQGLLLNPVFLSCLFSWFGAQLVKTIIMLLKGRIRSIKELFALLVWRTGGMPSSHSAIVSAMATSIGIRSGLDSDVFVLSMCFSLVVIRDALGVRRANGLQAKALNEMGKELSKKEIIMYKPVKEVHGHQPIEVFVGVLFGISMAVGFCFL